MNTDIEKGKNAAIVSYITIIGSVIAIFMNQDENKSEFASFHIRQGLGIFLTFFLLGYPIDGHFCFLVIYFYLMDLWFFRRTKWRKEIGSFSRRILSEFI